MPRKKSLGAPNPGAPDQPLRVPTGRSYGEAKELAEAQRAVPLPNSSAPQPTFTPMAALADAARFAAPNIGLGEPSQFPDQHVTAGIGNPIGLNRPAAPDPDALAIAQHLPYLEALAAQPSATDTTRALVRRLRAMLPPDFSFDNGAA